MQAWTKWQIRAHLSAFWWYPHSKHRGASAGGWGKSGKIKEKCGMKIRQISIEKSTIEINIIIPILSIFFNFRENSYRDHPRNGQIRLFPHKSEKSLKISPLNEEPKCEKTLFYNKFRLKIAGKFEYSLIKAKKAWKCSLNEEPKRDRTYCFISLDCKSLRALKRIKGQKRQRWLNMIWISTGLIYLWQLEDKARFITKVSRTER